MTKEVINLVQPQLIILIMDYWKVDAACFILGVFFIFSAIHDKDYHEIIISLCWIWVYPLILQTVLNLLYKFKPYQKITIVPSSRFVYHPNYNYAFWGFQRNHPFDPLRYSRVYQRIIKKKILKRGKEVRPSRASRALLIQKMSPIYLVKLCYGFMISRIIETKEWWLPSWVYRWKIMNPMLLAVEGSILASYLALKLGWSVNLSGGFHHASFDSGGGFCIYPDISLMVHYLQTRQQIGKIMIIDLDAHQGNGYEKDLIINEGVYIVDCYNSQIFPKDTESRDAIAKTIQIKRTTSNEEYLRLIQSIEMDFNFYHPEFVIFNAGTDVLGGDPLGELSMTRETILARDEQVVGMCRRRGIPVAMLLSGGYQQINAEIIADSLGNLSSKFP